MFQPLIPTSDHLEPLEEKKDFRHSRMFGVLVSGRPVMIASQPNSGIVQQSPTRWYVDIASPAEVSDNPLGQISSQIADISVFLISPLPNTAEGQPTGLSLYYSISPFEHWEFLSALSNAKPSIIVNPGWPLNPSVNQSPIIRLGISIEPASELLPKLETVEIPDFRRDFARKIALNLFRFIESFSQGSSRDVNFLRCPQDVLDKWLIRFDEKYKRDPNFILKTNQSR